MKSKEKFLRLILLGTTLLGAGLISGCSCNCPIHTASPPETVVEAYAEPQPADDLVAYLDPKAGKLLVLEEAENAVLAKLEAKRIKPGTYTMQALNMNMLPYTLNFTVHHVKSSSQLLLPPLPFPKTETFPGELVHEFQKRGTAYRIYQNARCVNLRGEVKYPCLPLQVKNRETGEEETKIFDEELLPISRCLKGADMCVEVYQVASIRRFFQDKDCKTLLAIETTSDWGCKPSP